ncbi:neuroligin-4, Y-linked-like [Mizuhopecten yessoensis]|uniref:neuroligin-4, Y-linked-like n=1 Tax=Mizuhopecten yessoensis TaxID=6573 RepID=UPI000B45CF63|nr:neuroligin-4, Y-linked-like [Mizuhopecten yessoensis]
MGLPVPDWPEFDENTRRFINLDTDITTGSDLLGDRIRFWTDEIPRIMSETEMVIDTAMGPIKGIVQIVKGATINQFRKVPFAKPPTGPLRFSKPVSISNWTDTLDATRFGPSCIQTVLPGFDFTNPDTSEDCLFLNIYVPNEMSMTANKSVMVWIHGGGYTSGSGMSYDGTSLAIHGDVIVVTLNYRLGVFGFLSTGDSSARGNYGLWDQIEALKWIKSNIKYFGGNPDSITLFGESAGAFSISHLAMIPENKGLFHRVVMQSGSLSSLGSITKDPLTKSRALGSHLTCNNTDNTTLLISCLREIDLSVLQSGAAVIYSSITSLGNVFEMEITPVIDGELIVSHPVSLLQNQSSEQFAFYQSLDVISGCNSAEASLYLMLFQLFPSLSSPAVNISDGVPSWVLKLFAQVVTEVYYNNDTRILQPIYDKYISTNKEEQGRRLVNLFGDIIFYIPMLESLLAHDREGNSKANTFQYFFSNQPVVDPVIGVTPKWFQGAGHFAEVGFLFDNWGYLQGDDKHLSKEMMSYWTNFAQYGNPNIGLSVPHWPEFDENTRRFINLDTDITTGSDLLGDRLRFWTDEIPRIMSETEMVIDTAMGPIKGIVQIVKGATINQFRKVPFAIPPTGPLRFSKPVSISNWTDTLDATRFGPSCIQPMIQGSHNHLPNPDISEDCLFLNIYVPNEISTTANKSVMVWIHGGGFRFGTGMSYDGSFLSLQGDVIVVTLNYRLGVFGFFSTGDSSARGNYGLWDQIEALKWIKTNIKYFGGNPDSITLFGESAGALSISHLAIFPENEGLFHRVIMQSGSLSSNRPIPNDSVKLARALGGLLQCSDIQSTESLVSCLRGKEASVLNSVSISQSFPLMGKYFGYAMSYAPVIDGEMITSNPFSLLQNRSSEQFKFYQSLDVICGCTSAEGSLFLVFFPLFPSLSLPPVNVSEGVPSWVLKLLAEAASEVYFNNDTRILPHIYNKYISTDIEEQGRLLVNFFSDTRFNVPMLESLLVHDRGGNFKANTFQYFFSKYSPGVLPKWFVGARHTAELPYLFNSGYELYGPDNVLSTQMASYWTNFAKHG